MPLAATGKVGLKILVELGVTASNRCCHTRSPEKASRVPSRVERDSGLLRPALAVARRQSAPHGVSSLCTAKALALGCAFFDERGERNGTAADLERAVFEFGV